jgi:dolichol kinase
VEKFIDCRDEGVFLVSHMSLLMGIAVPLWISIAEPTGSLSGKPFIVELMPGWSGLVALGISDTTAAVVGTKFGKTKVHRTSSKSVEGLLSGTVAMVAMLGAVAVYGGVSRDWQWWGCLMWYSLLTCTLEAVTMQLDNFVFPWHACTLMTLLT